MKKFKYLLLIISIVVLLFCVTTYTTRFNTNASDDLDFYDFEFETEKIREDGIRKVNIEISFATKKRIKIEGLTSKIENQQQDIKVKSQPIEKDDMYYYEIEFTIQNWQIGTLELVIEYSIEENFDPEGISSKTFYIPGGRWIDKDVNLGQAIIYGLVAAISVGAGTFIIIEISKKDLLQDR